MIGTEVEMRSGHVKNMYGVRAYIFFVPGLHLYIFCYVQIVIPAVDEADNGRGEEVRG